MVFWFHFLFIHHRSSSEAFHTILHPEGKKTRHDCCGTFYPHADKTDWRKCQSDAWSGPTLLLLEVFSGAQRRSPASNNAASCGHKLWAKAACLRGVFVRPEKWSGKLFLWRSPLLKICWSKKGRRRQQAPVICWNSCRGSRFERSEVGREKKDTNSLSGWKMSWKPSRIGRIEVWECRNNCAHDFFLQILVSTEKNFNCRKYRQHADQFRVKWFEI